MKFRLDKGFFKRLDEAGEEFLDKLGSRIEDYATDRVPVDTGKLQSEITYEINKEGGVTVLRVGFDVQDVPYGPFVEERTNFLYSSFVDGTSEIPEMLG